MRNKLKSLTLMILMLVSVFAVACGQNPNIVADMGILETDAPDMVELLYWWMFDDIWIDGDYQTPHQIILKSDNENAVFITTVEEGYFLAGEGWRMGSIPEDHNVLRTKTVKPNEMNNYLFAIPVRHDYLDYIKIVEKEEDHIVGYAFIKVTFECEDDVYSLVPHLIKAARFPKVDGEYQDITQEQMNAVFENFKKK